MNPRKQSILYEMGIQTIWQTRQIAPSPAAAAAPAPATHPEPPHLPLQAPHPLTNEPLLACELCALSEQPHSVLTGSGDQHSEWVFVSGQLTQAELDQSKALVGEPGQLFDQMLFSMGLHRQSVFVTHAHKCVKSLTLNPMLPWHESFKSLLSTQLRLQKPKMVVLMGSMAVQCLLGAEVTVEEARKTIHEYEGIALIATLHPEDLLKAPLEKALVWDDLRLAKKTLAQTQLSPAALGTIN
jgi:DNA polymerase